MGASQPSFLQRLSNLAGRYRVLRFRLVRRCSRAGRQFLNNVVAKFYIRLVQNRILSRTRTSRCVSSRHSTPKVHRLGVCFRLVHEPDSERTAFNYCGIAYLEQSPYFAETLCWHKRLSVFRNHIYRHNVPFYCVLCCKPVHSNRYIPSPMLWKSFLCATPFLPIRTV